MDFKEVVALIPARAGSVRVKNKNLMLLNGGTLIARKIKQLKDAGIFRVYVGSDSNQILEEAEKNGAIAVHRDPNACDESKSSANEMIRDFSGRVEGGVAIWAHCTNPFVYGKHYIEALKNFYNLIEKSKQYDSLLSVTKIQSHMWSDQKKPINYNPWSERHTLAKDLKPVYFQDGAIFIQKLIDFQSNNYFFGKKPHLFELDYLSSFDINFPEDLRLAEILVEKMDIINQFNL
jgi:CMP-N-acetylneuraminic acid synthetase